MDLFLLACIFSAAHTIVSTLPSQMMMPNYNVGQHAAVPALKFMMEALIEIPLPTFGSII